MKEVERSPTPSASDAPRTVEHGALVEEAPALQEVMDAFFRLTGLGMSITDVTGKVLVATGWQDICTHFHRVNPASCQNCVESDTTLAAGLEDGEYRLYRCQNSMWDMATPVTVDGKRVANLFFGQFFFDDEVPDRSVFERQATRYGFDQAQYLSALDRVPRVSRARVKDLMAFYSRLAILVGRLSQGRQAVRAQEAARASLAEARRVQEMFDAAPVGVFRLAPDGRLDYVNAATAELFGYPSAEAMQREVSRTGQLFATKEVREATIRPVVVSGGQAVGDVQLVRAEGSRFVGSLRARLVRDGEGHLSALEGFLTDVTEQRRTEAERHRAAVDEARLRGLSSRSNEIELVVALDGTIVEANDRATQAYGYSREELLALTIVALRAPTTLEAISDQMAHAGNDGGTRFQTEHRRRDGSTFPVEVSSRGFQVGGKRYLHSLIRDLTEQRATRRALAESEERLRLALAASHRVEWEHDGEDDVRIVGPQWQAVTGRTPEEGVDLAQWMRLVHPEDRDQVLGALNQCLEGKSDSSDLEYRVAQPSGGWRRLLSQAHVTASQGGRPRRLVGTLVDVTEIRDLQGRAARAERVASLATLSSGMAHEMNNPLAVVIANLGWAGDELGRAASVGPQVWAEQGAAAWANDLRQALLEASAEARRVGDIVGRLRLFSGGGVVSTTGRAALGPAIDEAMRMVAGELGRCKAVEVSVPGEARVAMSELALVQLLANLLKNAGQATGLRPNRVRVTAHPEAPGQLAIVVSDEGDGMDGHALAHAFDPFFTTKAVGREIGLGLPVCLGLAQAVGGDVKLDSAVGVGTTVTVVLPLR